MVGYFFVAMLDGYKKELPWLIIEPCWAGKAETHNVWGTLDNCLQGCFKLHIKHPKINF